MQVTQLLIVKLPRGLLAVSGDEGDRVSLINQSNRGLDLRDLDVQFIRYGLCNRHVGSLP